MAHAPNCSTTLYLPSLQLSQRSPSASQLLAPSASHQTSLMFLLMLGSYLAVLKSAGLEASRWTILAVE